MDNLISAYGGRLVDLMADPARCAGLRRDALGFFSIDLNRRQLSDLELLLNGGYSPLTGFMGRADYEAVLDEMQLADGTFWPIPVALDLSRDTADRLKPGGTVALRDPEGFMLAALQVAEVWQPDKAREAEALFGTSDPADPCVARFLKERQSHYVSGRLEGVSLPQHYDYPALRLTPAELRQAFARRGWRRVIAFQARQPLHRAQYEFTLRAALAYQANLLLHPVNPGFAEEEPEHFAFMRCCLAMLPRFPSATTTLALLPLYPRQAGMREILWRAIVQRNYGCTHLIVGGEHGESGASRRGMDLFNEDGLPAISEYLKTVEMELIPFPRVVYVEERAQHMPQEEVPEGSRILTLPGDELKRRLVEGLKIPDWFSYPEVLEELRKAYPPRDKQGVTVFFTGLSGAGKSTLAKVLMTKLLEMGGRRVTLLDGDIVRKHLSSELGFSREHRDINVRRIGYVASEITKNRGIAICAPIAPYQVTRRDVRAMIEPLGGFFEIYVSTPLEVCEQRDRKGLYAKARAGIVKEFTGVSDPYEVPEAPELILDTSEIGVDEAVQRILLKLEQEGYLR